MSRLECRNFEIVVKGKVSPTVLLALDGLEVSRYDEGKTCLVGWVPDQARLHGLLAIFRDLNMELVGSELWSPWIRSPRPEDSGFSARGPVGAALQSRCGRGRLESFLRGDGWRGTWRDSGRMPVSAELQGAG